MERLTTVLESVLTVGTAPDEQDLLAALLLGDEEAFGQLVDRYYAAMLHVARGFVRTTSAAEEVRLSRTPCWPWSRDFLASRDGPPSRPGCSASW
jgi:hypothetical protein